MSPQALGVGPLFTAIAVVAALSVGCKNDQARAEWWQDEQERIELTHRVELKQYRVDCGNANGFEELKRLRKSTQTHASLLQSLGQRREALNEDLALLEQGWADFYEAAIRDQRHRAIGKTFKSFYSASGREFRNVSVAAIDDAGVTIRHADGSARLSYEDLDSKLQVFFGLEANLAIAAEEKESRASIAYEHEIDSQMAVLQRQESRNSEIVRREETASQRKATQLALQQTATPRVRPLSQAATPLGNRSWADYRYSSSCRSSRYSNYQTYYPTYRNISNYVARSYNRYSPATANYQPARVAGSGCYSPAVVP